MAVAGVLVPRSGLHAIPWLERHTMYACGNETADVSIWSQYPRGAQSRDASVTYR